MAPLNFTLLLAASLSLPAASYAQTAKKSPAAKQAAHPSATEILLRDAQQAVERNDYSAGVDLYGKFLADHPAESFAHFQLAYCFTALKRRGEAVAEYRKAIEFEPKMGAAYLNLGLLLLESDPAGAAAVLVKAIDLLPAKAEPHYLAGTALERAGHPAEAVEHYRQAAALDESKWEYRIALAAVLLATKQVAEAEKEFRKSLELRPDYAAARLGLAQCLIVQQKLPEASDALHAYLETRPNDGESRLQLAAVYADLSRNEEALKELNLVSPGAEPSAEADRLRIDLLFRSKRYAESVAPLRRLLAREPNDALLHGRLGRVLLQQREFPGAQQELVAALKLDPKFTEALRDLSSVYLLAENYPAALGVMDELAKREQPGPGQWYLRALCYDKLHRRKEALEAYQKFLALNNGKESDQEFVARHRVQILSHELKK